MTRICIRCTKNPRMTGQKWCKGCHAEYMRMWRKKKAKADKIMREHYAKTFGAKR